MGVDDFRIVRYEIGCISVALSPTVTPFLSFFLPRLRAISTVRAARVTTDDQTLEIEYDGQALSAEAFLVEVGRELGLSVDLASLSAALDASAGTEQPRLLITDQNGPPIPEIETLEACEFHSYTAQDQPAAHELGGWVVRSALPGRIRLHHPLMVSCPPFREAIERLLVGLDGVDWFRASPVTGTVLVTYDSGQVGAGDVTAALASAERAALASDTINEVHPQVIVEPTALRLIMSTGSMVLSLTSFLAPALRPLAIGVTALAGSHIVVSAARALVIERRLRVDVLDATVVGLALGYQKVLAAGFMIWVVDLSNALLAAASRTQERNLAELFGRQARRAWRIEHDLEVDRPVSELLLGDVIVVRPGEPIPVDGEIVVGEAMIDRSALTGEHAAVECLPGDRVFAMSTVLAGTLQIVVRQTGADTTAARMVQIVKDSLEHKPHLQSLAERFAEAMVAPTFGLGGVAYGLSGPGPMLAVVNADFGTGIRIAGPLAMLSSLSAAARNGILIKKGGVLEDLGRMSAVVFDKTGTLTEETPQVGRVVTFADDCSTDQLIAYSAAAEQRLSHPIARGIVQAAQRLQLDIPAVEDAGYEVGLGVRVRINGRPFAIGSLRFIAQLGVAVSSDAVACGEGIHSNGGTAVFAAVDGRLMGVLEMVAVAREEASALVRYLKEARGIEEIHLLSGDHEAPVKMLAHRLGIEHHQAAMLPQEKADYVRALQARGLRVAMFGDGVNDTGGLAQADYSISLRGAADAATDVADIVFLDGRLNKFPLLDAISANLSRNVKRSFALTLIPNSICIAGAMTGTFGLGASLLFNNAGNLVTIVNGLRAQSRLQVQSLVA